MNKSYNSLLINWYISALVSNDYNVGKGWNLLVGNLCENILKLDGTVRIMQVKQKFGELRFYYVEGQDKKQRTKIKDLVKLAEMTSSSICEECGSYDFVSNKTGPYVQSLCHKCQKRLLC